MFYIEDRLTRHQESLRTNDPVQAERLVHARNEAHLQPEACRQIAQAYLKSTDPDAARRVWQEVFEEAAKSKNATSTAKRWQVAIKDPAFDDVLFVCSLLGDPRISTSASAREFLRRRDADDGAKLMSHLQRPENTERSS